MGKNKKTIKAVTEKLRALGMKDSDSDINKIIASYDMLAKSLHTLFPKQMKEGTKEEQECFKSGLGIVDMLASDFLKQQEALKRATKDTGGKIIIEYNDPPKQKKTRKKKG